ncbi:MAG: FAD-dependent 5-carboxymethylaminomethyl-2-thiouridine(34) oxidoreductase MnmC [Burkholderiaceae bacterium]|jgi:tRNA 5-methylaminomethyl-2-thiouridine biosynthesis bifunctional protein|nr:FAD-dependent 5-carboxymethylaminomethyl-2-thiouridine(34) oxidoreductase MnmC [Burkholderiaceae bacterium]
MLPTVQWQSDGTPVSVRYDDIYRGADGLAQARQVFLEGCALLAQPGAAALWAGQPVWQVLETGFGLGLNFLATWHAWQQDPARPARLFYSAVEAHPPKAADILRSAAAFAELHPLAEQLAMQWRGLLPGVHRIELAGGALQLTLAVGDAHDALAELTGRFDSVFLDGFSPRKNPAMWLPGVLRAVADLCRPGARAATWCVAGVVRKRLAACGFEVERVPGLAPKRHALRARYLPQRVFPRPLAAERLGEKTRDEKTVNSASANANAPPLPDLLPQGVEGKDLEPRRNVSTPQPTAPGRCAIVGAGVAGASLAYSLAARGWQVTVFGLGSCPADGASALPAGVFAPHVSPDDRPLSRLARAGCAATLARARALLREEVDFAASGVLERHAPGERRRPASWQTADEETESTAASALSTSASTSLRSQAGWPGDDDHPALWHAGAGWLRPAELVRAMLAAPGIRFVGDVQVARIAPHGNRWQVLDNTGHVLIETELVALAAGFDTLALLQASLRGDAAHWPLHALRGQLAFGPVPAGSAATLPPWPVNGHGNFVPAVSTAAGPVWVIGSTFERDATQPATSAAGHAANLQRLSELLPHAAAVLAPQWDDGRAQAWAGVRCTVPDRLPMAGPLSTEKSPPPLLVVEGWGGGNSPSAGNARPPPPPSGPSSAGESYSQPSRQPPDGDGETPHAPWVLTGFGTRGLTLAVLAAEIAAASLAGEPLPVERSLAQVLRASRWSERGAQPARRAHPHKNRVAQ